MSYFRTFTSTPATTSAVSQTSALLSLFPATSRTRQSQPHACTCMNNSAVHSLRLFPLLPAVRDELATSNLAVRSPRESAAHDKSITSNSAVCSPGLLSLPPTARNELATSNSAVRSLRLFPLLPAMCDEQATSNSAVHSPRSFLLFPHQALALIVALARAKPYSSVPVPHYGNLCSVLNCVLKERC